jgi:hypothetical protein
LFSFDFSITAQEEAAPGLSGAASDWIGDRLEEQLGGELHLACAVEAVVGA